MTSSRICKLVDCERFVHARDLCKKHYKLLLKYGDAEYPVRLFNKHGQSKTTEYYTWGNMIKRCHSPQIPEYKYYGARGIQVCERWRNSFESFLEDMGKKPSAEYTIERINVNGNYEPGNCRWATMVEQGLNKRDYQNNSTGFPGVYLRKESGRYRAILVRGGRRTNLGTFDTAQEASDARSAALRDAG